MENFLSNIDFDSEGGISIKLAENVGLNFEEFSTSFLCISTSLLFLFFLTYGLLFSYAASILIIAESHSQNILKRIQYYLYVVGIAGAELFALIGSFRGALNNCSAMVDSFSSTL